MSAKSKSLKPRQLQEAVMDYVGRQKNNTYNYKQVSHAIGVDTPAAQRAVALFLAELAFDGIIIEVAPGKFKSPARTVVATGVFSRRSNGTNSVITDEDGEQIFVAERNSMHALNGDRVAIEVAARVPGKDPEAVVTKILERTSRHS